MLVTSKTFVHLYVGKGAIELEETTNMFQKTILYDNQYPICIIVYIWKLSNYFVSM